ncbi:hypothetical protein I552_8879 [Mycobacterium xenopi 3993]|nr:hypothetical protein I552_8879 [Mycobacterium xenopi 3993]
MVAGLRNVETCATTYHRVCRPTRLPTTRATLRRRWTTSNPPSR